MIIGSKTNALASPQLPMKVYLTVSCQLVYTGLVCMLMRGYRDPILRLLFANGSVPQVLFFVGTLGTIIFTNATLWANVDVRDFSWHFFQLVLCVVNACMESILCVRMESVCLCAWNLFVCVYGICSCVCVCVN